MSYYPEQTQLDNNFVVYNGEEFGEDFVGERQQEEEFEGEEEFYSGHDFDPNDKVDSSGIEIRPTLNSRDFSSGKLFVGGVSWETTEGLNCGLTRNILVSKFKQLVGFLFYRQFTEYFSKYGEIKDSVIMMNKHSGRPRGFGFVTFSDSVVADKVLAEEHIIDGRVVEVKRTVPRENMEVKGVMETRKIFVGGIPPSFTDDELKEYFSSYGSILEYQIMLDRTTGRSRGFGFVTFESESSVKKVFSMGKIHELGGKQVEVKRAEPKGAGGDYSGSSGKSYGGFRSSVDGSGSYSSGGRNGGKRGRVNSEYNNMNGIYGSYGQSYGGSSATFYGNYGGGYGYGFGYAGPMFNPAGYGVNTYGIVGSYGGVAGYSDSKGYGRTGGYSNAGGYDSGKGYDKSDSSGTGRYHPYGR
ncbi:Heterogeneous nuclear ribonucleoprotein 1 [Quillaja saponaria]|uniref:Heterogeneous nuclear ribonucleoprotein 1 n=1 Tax=Quillaja saponaria TaxID=32244 RepID=A0AAD7L6K7_QUISA|nr:Heterogeneous nuclear ribonucleoprotein 1 [Quillaja saponaria]